MTPSPRQPFQRRFEEARSGPSPEMQRMIGLLVLVALVGGGVFWMQYSALQKAEREAAEKAHRETRTLVPREKLTPEQIEARKTALYAKFEGALADTENDQPLNYNETPGYRKLLEILIHFTPEEVTERTQVEFDWKTAMDDPDGWRGEFVRARGVLGMMWAIKLKTPVLGRKDVYRAVLADADHVDEDIPKDKPKPAILIDLTERPPDIVSDSREVLEVEGVFYRTVLYEGRDGSQQRQPLLVVRNIRRLQSATETGWRLWLSQNGLWIVAGLALFVISAVLLFSSFRRQRRPPRGGPPPTTIHDMFDQKLREAGKVPPPRD